VRPRAKVSIDRSRDPTIFGILLNISSKLGLLDLETSNMVSVFDLPLLFDCRVLHTMVYCEAVRSAILATARLLVIFSYCIRYIFTSRNSGE